jgi:hypothetical protein
VAPVASWVVVRAAEPQFQTLAMGGFGWSALWFVSADGALRLNGLGVIGSWVVFDTVSVDFYNAVFGECLERRK